MSKSKNKRNTEPGFWLAIVFLLTALIFEEHLNHNTNWDQPEETARHETRR